MSSALLVIDVQNDFCAGGSLAVPDAEGIIPLVNELMRDCAPVILTQDWHPRGHISFASSHPGRAALDRVHVSGGEQMLWPDHCVAETPGAAFHSGLEIPCEAMVIRKGIRREADSYSAFFENDRVTPVGLDAMLRSLHANAILVVGLATDYCVLHTALDGRRLGYDVSVVEPACRGIDRDGGVAAAWTRMGEAGVRRLKRQEK